MQRADVIRAHARLDAGMSRLNARSDAKKKPHKIPSKEARRRSSPVPPVQAERDLARAFVAMAAKVGKKWRSIFLPLAHRIGRLHVEERTDAAKGNTKLSAEDKAAVESARVEAERAAAAVFSKAAIRSETERAARRVESHSKDQFRKLGVSVEKEPVLKVLVSGWTRDVSERVHGITTDQARILEEILLSGHSRFASTLADEIEERLGILEGRAEFLARDSIGTINGLITRERFRAADISKYVWTSVGDSRVRDRHAELDSQIFDVDGPGDEEEGNAGDAPNCRCVCWPMPKDDAPADETDEAAKDD